jgi:hypothetical protein
MVTSKVKVPEAPSRYGRDFFKNKGSLLAAGLKHMERVYVKLPRAANMNMYIERPCTKKRMRGQHHSIPSQVSQYKFHDKLLTSTDFLVN